VEHKAVRARCVGQGSPRGPQSGRHDRGALDRIATH
jgi:hypothetical protein